MSGKVYYTCYTDVIVKGVNAEERLFNVRNKVEKLLSRNHWTGRVAVFGQQNTTTPELIVGELIIQLEDKPSNDSLKLINMRLKEIFKLYYKDFTIGETVVVERFDPLLMEQFRDFIKTGGSLNTH